MKKHYEKIICDTQARVEKSLRIQNLQKGSPYYGAFSQDDGVYQAKYSIYRVASMTAAYCNKDTCYYHQDEIYERIMLGFSYIKRVQHENGLFDYITCNFYSAPDTAFCIKKLIPVLQYLIKKEKEPETTRRFNLEPEITQKEKEIKRELEDIIYKGAQGMLEGGFHTPNHRWAIASVLVTCGKIFSDEKLIQGADQYLNEGIDCNEDGEFSEKSAGNYNRVNNDAMMMLSEGLGNPDLEQYAIRNLKMMLTYIEPDDSVFTANSTRFDKDHLIFPKDYYYEYLSTGIRYDITEFLDMANYIFDVVFKKQITSPDFLMQLMNHPEYIDYEHESSRIPKKYRAFYKESGIARVRKDEFTYTVMKEKSNFLYVNTGSIKLEMKIGGSFCEHRAFKAEDMQEEADGFKLSQTMRGWYYLPFEEKPETSDWWKMDNGARNKKMGPDMKIDVFVKDVEGGIDVEIQTSGVEGAPWRVELAFSGINRIGNEHMTMPVHGDETIVMRDSFLEASNNNDVLTIGPAFGTHHFIEGKEDSEVKTPGAATVYFTDYTEFHHVISIRRGGNGHENH